MRGWWVIFGWIGFSLAGAAPPDYAREDRWADEIVPAIVVGEAVYLATPARSRVLAIYHRCRAAPRAPSSSCTAWACIRIGA